MIIVRVFVEWENRVLQTLSIGPLGLVFLDAVSIC